MNTLLKSEGDRVPALGRLTSLTPGLGLWCQGLYTPVLSLGRGTSRAGSYFVVWALRSIVECLVLSLPSPIWMPAVPPRLSYDNQKYLWTLPDGGQNPGLYGVRFQEIEVCCCVMLEDVCEVGNIEFI